MILDNCCDQEAFQSWSWNWSYLWPRSFSTSILTKEMSATKGAFQPWSWRKVIKGFSTFKSKLSVTKGLFNMKEPFATKGLFNLYLDEGIVCDQRGFSISILTKGNQGAFQPWNQTCSRQRGISTSILTKELFATKGLFIFDLYEGIVCDQGAS